MFDIITIGSATRDVFLQSKNLKLAKTNEPSAESHECLLLGKKLEVDNILFSTGGGGTNTAVTFRRLGLKTAVLSRVGDDPGGRQILSGLKQEKINTDLIVKDEKNHTGYSIILLPSSGQRTIFVFRGASGKFSEKEILWSKLKTKWFYVSSLGGNINFLGKVVSFAKKNKINIAVNPGEKELSCGLNKLSSLLKDNIKILILNRNEASCLSQQPINDINKIFTVLYKKIPSTIAITDGANGAYIFDGKNRYYSKSLGKKVVNTTGAGDGFGSAFTTGMILKNDLEYSLKLAIINSGMVVTKMGAKAGILKTIPPQDVLNKIKTVKQKI